MWSLEVNTDDLADYLETTTRKIDRGIPDLFTLFSKTLADRAKKAFDEQGFPTKWAPSLAAKKEHRKTLIKSGRLKRSFEDGEVENFFQVVGDQMLWGSLTPYGPYLYDEDLLNPHVPLREIIEHDSHLTDDLNEDMAQWMEGILHG